MLNSNTKLVDCSLSQFSEALIRGNGFGNETIWIKAKLGSEQFGIVEETITSYYNNVCQFCLTDFFKSKGFSLAEETYYDDSGEVSVTYENIDIDLDVTHRIYKNAILLFNNAKGQKICVCINNFGPREINYKLYAPLEFHSLLKDWTEYGRKNSFYKGKKLDAELRFLNIKNITWDDVILPEKTLNIIKNNLSELFDMREFLDANDIPLKSGIILSGPPGTGKTQIVKILAKEQPMTVLYAMPDHISKTTGIKGVCELAKDLAPCLLIIEDIDYIAEEREYNRNAGGVIELMNYLDGMQDFTDVITLATTNAVDKLEGAVKNRPGRFDRTIKIPNPDAECRKRMFVSFTKKYTIDQEVNFDKCVTETEDLSGAHIKDLCKTAVRNAIRERSVNENKIAILKQSHFDRAFKEVKNIDYASHYKDQQKTRNHMGFRDH